MADTVNHPAHYNAGRFEVIDVIEDWKLGFNLGNAVKYIARADHKGTRRQDLLKAMWYLDREVQRESPFSPTDVAADVERPTLTEEISASWKGGKWQVEEGSRSESADETVQPFGTIEDKVCHLLNGAPDEMFTVDQIEKATGVARRSLCSCLSRLLRRGVIAKPARGVYCSRRSGRVRSSRG